MSFSELQAVTILFDNSSSTINGDVLPTRFDAAKSTVESLARAYLRSNRESVVGFGCLSDEHFGIHVSLSKDARAIRQGLEAVRRGGRIALAKGIKCGLYSLRHRPKEISNRRLVVILCSPHGLTARDAEELSAFTNREGVRVDLVVFGSDAIDAAPLRAYIGALGDGSFLHVVDPRARVLSDAVQQLFVSAHRGGGGSAAGGDAGLDADADLRRALEESQRESGGDAELQEALRLSMMEYNGGDQGIDDPDLLAALQLSMQSGADDAPAAEAAEGAQQQQTEDMNAYLDNEDEMRKLYEEFGIDPNDKHDEGDKKKK